MPRQTRPSLRRPAALLVALLGPFAAPLASADEPPPLPPPPAPAGVAPPLPPPPTTPEAVGRATPPALAPAPGAFSYGTPAPQARAETEMKRRSTPMMVTGIVLTGLGAVTAIYGGAILAGDGNNCLLLASNRSCDGTNQDIVGAVMVAAGGTLVATGLPLLIVGGSEIPVDPAQARSAFTPTVRVGPGAGALRWTF